MIDVGPMEILYELTRVGRQTIEETALAFSKDDVVEKRRLARPTQPRDNDKLLKRNIYRDIPQIILPCADDADGRSVPVDSGRRSATRARLLLGTRGGFRLCVKLVEIFLQPCPSHRPHSRRLPPLRVGPATSSVTDFHDVTGGVYKARERIQRSVLTCVY